MTHDVAIFLDLDNLVIGAKQIDLVFDINLVLARIKEITNGRIVLRRSYGDWRQGQALMYALAAAGFNTQSAVRLNNFSKNLADMQIVVDAMDTLVDGRQYDTYVLITGDRDFTPLVQSLRKRGKRVIGVGMKASTSRSLSDLCDQYIYYEDLVPVTTLPDTQVEDLLRKTLGKLLKKSPRVRASVLSQKMMETSKGLFGKMSYEKHGFRKFLALYPHVVKMEQENSTTYVIRPEEAGVVRPLHLRYRTELKKLRLRIVPAEKRLPIIKDIVSTLQQGTVCRWRQIVDKLANEDKDTGKGTSKNSINAVMLALRRAQVIQVTKEASLASASVRLSIDGIKLFQEAVLRCDTLYLQEILALSDPFDLQEAAVALYDTPYHARYLQVVIKKWVKKPQP